MTSKWVSTVAAACATIGLAAHQTPASEESVHFVPADRVSVRRMGDVPPIELAPAVQVRTVVGTTGSFSIADFEPGSAAVLHHHAREQADISLAGTFDMTLDDRVERLGPGAGVIVPPNVAHSIANHTSARSTVIEFHTVRRPDLVPPRPAITFPASVTPARLSAGRQLVQPMDGPAPESPSSDHWLRGETCLLAWRRITSGAAPVELRAGAVERFAYLVRGEVQLTSAAGRVSVKAGALIVVPARGTITIQASGPGNAAVAEFIPAASEK